MDDGTDHTKKRDRTNKTSGEKSSSKSGDAIITPLKVSIEEKNITHSTITQSDSAKRAYVIAGLLIMIIGGLWLFNFLSDNPVSTAPPPAEKILAEPASTIIPSTTTVPRLEEDTKIEQGEKEAAEQKLAQF